MRNLYKGLYLIRDMKLRGVKDGDKRAISPVITTILLVLLVVILAMIILLWGLTFIPESLSKFGGPIEDKCGEISFTASYSGNRVTLVNNGNIPIYEVGIRDKDGPISNTVYKEVKLNPGTSDSFEITSDATQVEIIPVILGETEDNEIQKFSCKNKEIWEIVTL